MVQAFVANTTFSRVPTTIAGISKPLNSLHFVLVKLNERLKKSILIIYRSTHLCLLVLVNIYHLQISGCCIYTAVCLQILHKSDMY